MERIRILGAGAQAASLASSSPFPHPGGASHLAGGALVPKLSRTWQGSLPCVPSRAPGPGLFVRGLSSYRRAALARSQRAAKVAPQPPESQIWIDPPGLLGVLFLHQEPELSSGDVTIMSKTGLRPRSCPTVGRRQACWRQRCTAHRAVEHPLNSVLAYTIGLQDAGCSNNLVRAVLEVQPESRLRQAG